jgi:hypothetical protein
MGTNICWLGDRKGTTDAEEEDRKKPALRTVTDADLRLVAGGTIWKIQGPADALSSRR